MRELISNNLPLNRKERFYTGTVFPMIVGKDNFQHLHLLFSLFKESNFPKISSQLDSTNLQFYTEYSLQESLFNTGREFKGSDEARDTPDIILLINGPIKVLIALEAKMFDVPSKDELNTQMKGQSKVLECIKTTLDIDLVFHIALLPKTLYDRIGDVTYDKITWESLLEIYRPVCQGDHFFELLAIALEDYHKLVSFEVTFRKNNEELMSGISIYQQFSDKSIKMVWMGRAGGLNGTKLQEDLKSGKWRARQYETRSTPLLGTGKNWFEIKEFIKIIDSLEKYN